MTLLLWLTALPLRFLAALGLRRTIILVCLFTLAVTLYGVAEDLGLLEPPAQAAPAPRRPAAGQPRPSRAAVADIPAAYLRLYRSAGATYRVPWSVLAAIGKVESDHGRARLPGVRSGSNWAGACGPMQIGCVPGSKAGNAWARYGRGRPHDPANAIPAAARYLVEEAIEVSRAWADAGDELAARKLADLLAEHGRVEELRARADAGVAFAARKLADLLAEQGHVEEAIEVLRARNDDRDAAFRLADLLAKQSRVDEEIEVLRTLADDREQWAAYRLADVLAKQGRVDEEIEVLKAPVLAGEDLATYRLANLLAEHGRVEELRARADAGDDIAAYRLAEKLVEQGHVDEAIELLRAFADADHESDAFPPLVRLLTTLGCVEEAIEALRTIANAGVDYYAASWLAESLADQGRIEEAIEVSRAYADTGDGPAAYMLTKLLAEQDRVDELEEEVNAGIAGAAPRLIALLAERGQPDRAERLRTFGFNPDGSIADTHLPASSSRPP